MKKGFKFAAMILTLAICIIAHPFSVVHALGPQEYINSGSGTNNSINYRWDRYVWCSDPNVSTDPIQVEVDGNTFWACEYTVFEVYFQNPANGTFRVNKPSGSNIGDYTFYVNGGIVSSRMTNYMTIKFTNVTHVKVVITTYNQTSFADPTSVFTLSNFSLSTPTDSSQTTLNDIDVLLSNVDYTLQDILGYINGPSGIIDKLDVIETYAEYLDDISLNLQNIDNIIDTISWNHQNISFTGWTTNFSSFDTSQNTLHSGGYYYFQPFSFNGNYNCIYRLTFPIKGELSYKADSFNIYLRVNNSNQLLQFDNYLFSVSSNFITYYILFDYGVSYSALIQGIVFEFKGAGPNRSSRYTYDQYLNFDILPDTDIEYWTLRNTIIQNKQLSILQTIANGSTDTSTATSIDSITSDLNDQIAASNSATSSTEALLDNFNQNINISDYNFNISTGDHVTYFKQKLTDIYEIDEFKPFYLIPIILFVLGRILAG